MKLNELVKYLYEYFNLHNFPSTGDNSQNGLQVEASEEITKIVTAVDACMETFEKAVALQSQLILVHHGIFWGKSLLINGLHGQRIRYLMQNNLSLYAMHIPLDIHSTIGNNVQLAKLLGLEIVGTFGNYNGIPIGIHAKSNKAISLNKFAHTVKSKLKHNPLMLSFGSKAIQNVGIITGSGASEIMTASKKELDILLTGEGTHSSYHQAKDIGMNVLYAGHYATETLGIHSLGEHLSQKFSLQHEFIDIPTGF